jgi:hypothetical protein
VVMGGVGDVSHGSNVDSQDGEVLKYREAELVEGIGDIRNTTPAADAKGGLQGEVGAELDRSSSSVTGAIVLVGGVGVPHGMLMR